MNHQELRDIICSKKPRYNAAFKPLMERISIKGDASGKVISLLLALFIRRTCMPTS